MKKSSDTAELIADLREQLLYMRELGVEMFDAGSAEATRGPSIETLNKSPAFTEPESKIVPPKKPSRLSGLPSLSRRGSVESRVSLTEPIETLKQTEMPRPVTSTSLREALFDIGPALPESGETIEAIRADIGDCTRCELHSGRTQVVHSTGSFQADLMFVGEAPGADEDAQGFPFVGRAGQLLTRIIEGIGLTREQVFIGNINRCRPPGNRAPSLAEAHTCRPFLLREIAVVKPKVIVVLGNTAMHNLLDTKVGITKMRGQFQDYFSVKVMPTFHPAFLLRDPHKKREVWEDMKKVRDYLNSTK